MHIYIYDASISLCVYCRHGLLSDSVEMNRLHGVLYNYALAQMAVRIIHYDGRDRESFSDSVLYDCSADSTGSALSGCSARSASANTTRPPATGIKQP